MSLERSWQSSSLPSARSAFVASGLRSEFARRCPIGRGVLSARHAGQSAPLPRDAQCRQGSAIADDCSGLKAGSPPGSAKDFAPDDCAYSPVRRYRRGRDRARVRVRCAPLAWPARLAAALGDRRDRGVGVRFADHHSDRGLDRQAQRQMAIPTGRVVRDPRGGDRAVARDARIGHPRGAGTEWDDAGTAVLDPRAAQARAADPPLLADHQDPGPPRNAPLPAGRSPRRAPDPATAAPSSRARSDSRSRMAASRSSSSGRYWRPGGTYCRPSSSTSSADCRTTPRRSRGWRSSRC